MPRLSRMPREIGSVVRQHSNPHARRMLASSSRELREQEECLSTPDRLRIAVPPGVPCPLGLERAGECCEATSQHRLAILEALLAQDVVQLSLEDRDALRFVLYGQRRWRSAGESLIARIQARAVTAGDAETLLTLCNFGLYDRHRMNQTSMDGEFSRALHVASRDDKEELVQFLIDNKADVHVTNLLGQTPLHLAPPGSEVARLLLDAGADPDAEDDFGEPAFGE